MAKAETIRRMISRKKTVKPAEAEQPATEAAAPPAPKVTEEFGTCRECGKLQEGVIDGACPGCRARAAGAEQRLDDATTAIPAEATADGLAVEHVTPAEVAPDLIPAEPSAPIPADDAPPAPADERPTITSAESTAEPEEEPRRRRPLGERFKRTLEAVKDEPQPPAAEPPLGGMTGTQAEAATAIADDAARATSTPPTSPRMLLAIAGIREHPANPRLLYPRIAELGTDIAEHGLRDPIKVRPVEGGYEVISGHRRLRAMKAIGWTEVPAIIEPLDDLAAYQEVVANNEHREDLTAIEEGLAFAGLLQRGQTVEQVATFIGKSVAHVYARMKLTSLCEAGRQAMVDGWLTPETGLLVARIPTPALQEKALKEIGPDEKQGHDAMSYREAQAHIQQRFMLLLSKAPFDRKAEDLVAGAGACSACPKRSGALPAELRTDMKGADICLDRDCFEAKTAADWTIRKAAAAEAKVEAIDAAEAEKRHLVYAGDRLAEHNGVCTLESTCHEDSDYREWKKVLPKKAVPPPDVLIQSPYTGAPIQGWKRETLMKAAVEAKVLKPHRASGGGVSSAQAEKEAAARKKIREERKVAHAAIEKVMGSSGLLRRAPVEVWRELAEQALEHTWGQRIAKRRGLEAFRPGLEDAIKKMEIPEIQDLLVEAMLQREVETMLAPYGQRNRKPFCAMIEALGVTWDQAKDLAAGGADEEDDEPAEKAAPAKKDGAKGPLARKMKGGKKK